MRKPVWGVLMLGLLSATTAEAEEEVAYDPLEQKAVLAYAQKSAIDSGTGALVGMGKHLLGAVADAYAPGAAALLGLGGEDSTQKVLDAIEADGTRTRDLILDFWDWARAQQGAAINADYATVEWQISSWNALPPELRLPNRGALDAIVSDCVNVMARFQTAPRPIDRVDHLHAYVTLLSLTIALEAERSELQILGAEWEFSGGGDPADWWDSLGGDEQSEIIDVIQETKRARVEDLLLPGLQVSFADQMAEMDAGVLPGGTPGTWDFESALTWQIGPLTAGYPPDGEAPDGQARWFYFVGHNDPQPNCANKTRYCKAYMYVRGAYTTACDMHKYVVDFKGAYNPPCYADDFQPYVHHQQLLAEDLIVRGYGPVRALAESWWDVWELGDRNRLGIDDYIDTYLEMRDSVHERTLSLITNQMTKNITPAQKSRLYGFALQEGLNAVVQLASAASAGPDYMNGTVSGLALMQFPWSVHRSAIRAYPTSFERLSQIYRAVPVAKLVAANII